MYGQENRFIFLHWGVRHVVCTHAAPNPSTEFILDYQRGPNLANASLQSAIERVQRGMAAALKRSKSSKHSTGTIWSKMRKSKMKAELRNDPAFGIMNFILEALRDTEKRQVLHRESEQD